MPDVSRQEMTDRLELLLPVQEANEYIIIIYHTPRHM